MKITFRNDYSEGCHTSILQALSNSNLEQQEAYGLDGYSLQAEKFILDKCNAPYSKVHFVSGGTQANLIVISSLLRPFESVISASTGHIYNNEAGAIEATGHKVCSALSDDGKLTIWHIQQVLEEHARPPHQVKPKLVYISNSTELGTAYSKNELEILADFCKKNDLYLYMDGARLGSALMSQHSDVSLADIAQLTDIFYIGGTKNGALIGEAIVINNPAMQTDFEFNIKQKGAMLSKGRLLGIQFYELFKDNLYNNLAALANEHAMKIKAAFQEIGCDFLVDTFTNQIFPILENDKIERLSAQFDFYVWRKINAHKSALRIITSWASTASDVNTFIKEIESL